MRKSIKLSLALTALLGAGGVLADPMYIDLGTNSYDTGRFLGTPDANTTTAAFNLLGFTDLWATSIYDFSDGSIFGAFVDTNMMGQQGGTDWLSYYNVPASGTALDGSTHVDLVLPDCPNGQCDIDALSPLVPPLGTDNEGFLQTWDLQTEYYLTGYLDATGPHYTGGYFDVYFNDFNNDANDRKVLTATVAYSEIATANLNVYFDITFAEDNFLWIDSGGGTFIDANDGVLSGNFATLRLDTNVDPPIPTADQLLLVTDDGGNDNAIRQASLDGSLRPSIPEPSTIALMSLSLLGVGAAARRRRRS